MKSTIIKSAFLAVLAAGIFSGCVNDDDYSTPSLACTETNLVKTLEVADVPATGTVKQYTQDDVIEAYVTSSDEGGNFFKTISFQTLDGSNAFSIPVDVTNTFITYNPGRKVFIKLKDLYTDISNGGVRIGAIFISSSGTAQVGRMPLSQVRTSLIKSCTNVSEDVLVQKVTVAQANSDEFINKLIEIDNVEFADSEVGKTYYDAGSPNTVGGATNRTIIDMTGATLVFRTSSFANFAASRIPAGSGKIRGVVTKFNGIYQFLARTERDVMLTGDRFSVDFAPPKVGDAITFSGNFTENFESYGTTSPANQFFPKYINDPVVGSRYWANVTFGGNKYIQMSSFGGTPEANRVLFFVPVDLTAANNFSFQSKAGFGFGTALKVYYILASNYTPGGVVNDADLIDITSNFTISPGQASGYPGNFTDSGVYAIPAAITGNGFFVFEYLGNGTTGPTTTIQVDNIVVN